MRPADRDFIEPFGRVPLSPLSPDFALVSVILGWLTACITRIHIQRLSVQRAMVTIT